MTATLNPAQAFVLGMAAGIVLALVVERAKARRVGCSDCPDEEA